MPVGTVPGSASATLAADWGDVPSWIGGIASFGALVAAVAAALIARQVYRIESQRDRLTEDERREAQAALVAAWPDEKPNPTGGRDLQVMLSNGSTQPVFDVDLRVTLSLQGISLADYQTLVNIDHMAAQRIDNYHDVPAVVSHVHMWVLPPGYKGVVPEFEICGFRGSGNDADDAVFLQRIYSFQLTLTDVRGHRWHRDHQGRLRRA